MPLPTELGTVIARRRMAFVRDGTRRPVDVLIGQPQSDPRSTYGDCFCPSQVIGLECDSKVTATFGIDGIQALSLTFKYLDNWLQDRALVLGGRLTHDDGDDYGPFPWLGNRDTIG